MTSWVLEIAGWRQCIVGDSNLEQITERQLLALAESFGGEHQRDEDSIE